MALMAEKECPQSSSVICVPSGRPECTSPPVSRPRLSRLPLIALKNLGGKLPLTVLRNAELELSNASDQGCGHAVANSRCDSPNGPLCVPPWMLQGLRPSRLPACLDDRTNEVLQNILVTFKKPFQFRGRRIRYERILSDHGRLLREVWFGGTTHIAHACHGLFAEDPAHYRYAEL